MQEENVNMPGEIQENAAIEFNGAAEEKPSAPKHPFFVFTINTVLGLVVLAGLVILYILVLTKKEINATSFLQEKKLKYLLKKF